MCYKTTPTDYFAAGRGNKVRTASERVQANEYYIFTACRNSAVIAIDWYYSQRHYLLTINQTSIGKPSQQSPAMVRLRMEKCFVLLSAKDVSWGGGHGTEH